MPGKIIEKKEKTSSPETHRDQFLNKKDVQDTFLYGLVGVFCSVAIWGVSYSFIKQVNKN